MATQKGKIKLRTGESYRAKEDRFMYRWTDANGKRHSAYASTIGELREKEQQIQKDTLNGMIYSDMTVAQLYEKWIKLKTNLKPNSLHGYKMMYTTQILPNIGKYKICDVKKSDLRAWCVDLAQHDYSVGYIKKLMTILRQMFELAVDDDLIQKNPASHALQGILPEEGKRESLTLDEERELFQFASKDHSRQDTYLVMCILLNTGLRVGEFCALTWNDVDLTNRNISITKTLSLDMSSATTKVMIGTPKTKSSVRTIPISEHTAQLFLQLKELIGSYHLTQTPVVDGYTDFCYITSRGEVGHPRMITDRISYTVNKCNKYLRLKYGEDNWQIRPITAHVLRHTFATRMCEAGANPKATQGLLGHANIDITMNVYTDITDIMQRQALQSLKLQYNISTS